MQIAPEQLHLTGTAAHILDTMTDQHHELVNLLLKLREIRHHRAIEEYQAAVLYHLARRYNRRECTVLEIGTAKGYSASVIARAIDDARLITLNPDPDEATDARHALATYPNATVLVKKSWDMLDDPAYDTLKFDLIFVDGDHKNIRLDLPFWKRLKVGGLMLFHDYSPNGAYRACPPVYRALNEFREALGREFDVLVVDSGGVGMAGFVKQDGDDLETAERDLLAGVNLYSSASFGSIVGLYQLAQSLQSVEGALVECGCQNGGSAAALALGLGGERKVWLFDSFEGVPKPQPEDGDKAMQRWQDKQEVGGWAAGSQKTVRECLKKAGIKGAKIISGDFNETFAAQHETGAIAILHIDATLYASTKAALARFYDDVTPGGVVVLSAYAHWGGIQRAVFEFFAERQEALPRLHNIEKNAWWTK